MANIALSGNKGHTFYVNRNNIIYVGKKGKKTKEKNKNNISVGHTCSQMCLLS